MGALHQGHLSLVTEARKHCDIVVASIFVNPTQFNDPKDFERYPRHIERDIELLSTAACDAVFIPEAVEQIYPPDRAAVQVDLGLLGQVMEGKYRPGHFDGVVNVVSRLFDIVRPHMAFFGLKDYQQFRVIQYMVQQLQIPVELVGVPTTRNADGLALSSRNQLLSDQERQQALAIIRCMQQAKARAMTSTGAEIKAWVKDYFDQLPEFALEYAEVAHGQTLAPIEGDLAHESHPVLFIAAKLGKVRLIDNLFLKN